MHTSSTSPLWIALCISLLAVLASAGCGGEEQDTTNEFTVLTFNIWHDQQDWPARRDRILDRLQAMRPDLVCLQEVLQTAELPNQAQTIAEHLGYEAHFVSVDSVGAPKRYGNAILSPHPVLAKHQRLLNPRSDYRVAAHARVSVNGSPIDAYCTHLHYSGEGGGADVRGPQIKDLLAFVDSTRGEEAPVIVAGDFNTPPDAEELRLLTDDFTDAYAATQPGEAADRPTTVNPHAGHTPRYIDYIFSSLGLTPVSTDIVFDEPYGDSLWASDHFGVLARFELPAPERD